MALSQTLPQHPRTASVRGWRAALLATCAFAASGCASLLSTSIIPTEEIYAKQVQKEHGLSEEDAARLAHEIAHPRYLIATQVCDLTTQPAKCGEIIEKPTVNPVIDIFNAARIVAGDDTRMILLWPYTPQEGAKHEHDLATARSVVNRDYFRGHQDATPELVFNAISQAAPLTARLGAGGAVIGCSSAFDARSAEIIRSSKDHDKEYYEAVGRICKFNTLSSAESGQPNPYLTQFLNTIAKLKELAQEKALKEQPTSTAMELVP